MTCPRCNTRLGIEHDPDYAWCINHGPVYIGNVLPPPSAAYFCACGERMAPRSSHCRKCAQRERQRKSYQKVGR